MAGILNTQQERKIGNWFDANIQSALHVPRSEDYAGDMAGLRNAQANYASNPLVEVVAPVLDYIKSQKLNGYDPVTGNLAVGSDADTYLQGEIAAKRQKFISGAQAGKPDDGTSTQGAIQSLMTGDWEGAAKQLVLGLPIAGQYIAAFGKWLKSMTGGNNISMGDAKEYVTLGEGVLSGIQNLGLTKTNADINSITDQITANQIPTFSAAQRLINVGPSNTGTTPGTNAGPTEGTASGANAGGNGIKHDTTFPTLPNGSLPPNPGPTPSTASGGIVTPTR